MDIAGRSVAVGVFAHASWAQQAAQALRALGTGEREIALFAPDEARAAPAGTIAGVDGPTDVETTLGMMGVSGGELRFYSEQARSGQALLVVVAATPNYGAIRDVILQHGGHDVQSRGAELVRAAGAGVPGGTGPRPIDVTGRWEDVASRYEMLWQQHYGTSDTTWDAIAPTYRFAWHLANEPRLRGRPWAEAEPSVRAEWQRTHPADSWNNVAGPIRDVWEDVAAEAGSVAEGGRDRNVRRTTE